MLHNEAGLTTTGGNFGGKCPDPTIGINSNDLLYVGTSTGGMRMAAAAGFMLWVERRRYRAWAYREREEDLIVSRGVLVRRVSVVPYGRMQFVEVTAGPFERVFRLATVQLHTAAAASDARIPGLERDEAARLRDRLAMLGEARAAGL